MYSSLHVCFKHSQTNANYIFFSLSMVLGDGEGCGGVVSVVVAVIGVQVGTYPGGGYMGCWLG